MRSNETQKSLKCQKILSVGIENLYNIQTELDINEFSYQY